METYTINEIAMMTGLSTRTLRTYLKLGLLNGEKDNGIWRFTAVDLDELISNPAVRPSIQAKNKAALFDFLADDKKKVNEICIVLDLNITLEKSKEVSAFFCQKINSLKDGKIQFNCEINGNNTRIILCGYEDIVTEIMAEYYSRKALQD